MDLATKAANSSFTLSSTRPFSSQACRQHSGGEQLWALRIALPDRAQIWLCIFMVGRKKSSRTFRAFIDTLASTLFRSLCKMRAQRMTECSSQFIPNAEVLPHLVLYTLTILESFELLIGSVVQYFFKVISDHNRHF